MLCIEILVLDSFGLYYFVLYIYIHVFFHKNLFGVYQFILWYIHVYCLLYIHLLMDIKHICIHHVGLVYHTWHMISKLHMGRTRKNDETHDFQFLACFALLARWLTCVQFLSNAAFIHMS